MSRKTAGLTKRMAAVSPTLGSQALHLLDGDGLSATSGSQKPLPQPQSPPSYHRAASCQERGRPFLPNTATLPASSTLRPTSALCLGGVSISRPHAFPKSGGALLNPQRPTPTSFAFRLQIRGPHFPHPTPNAVPVPHLFSHFPRISLLFPSCALPMLVSIYGKWRFLPFKGI